MESQKKENFINGDYYLFEKIGKIESDIEYQGKATEELKSEMNRRFEEFKNDMDRRFEEFKNDMDSRFNEFKLDINKRFDDVNKRFDEVNNDMNRRFDKLYVILGLGFTFIVSLITVFNFI